MSFAQVTLLGRLGQNPEKKEVGENKLARFTLATNRLIKGEKATDWHSITAWNKLGKFAVEHLTKGSQVLVVGRLESNKTDKGTFWNVVATDIKFADAKPVNHAQDVVNDAVNAKAPEVDTQDEISF